ncbi:cellulase family glycosylhydrolase [Streptomyces sp. NBC_01408]|uniref:cellulase family glycosylhydrolase n=1 Tax=Streptomyces sp. NBC_01408 TaxID=2903855 RepID=UPI0022595397|nr:cellulase family glycosylhydrolase [Streptomyces sp. NBC_01408]MCX4695417.1 cellulase family glycosylhydrolase [Streptomyces sp. NBC_01408]
MRPPRLRLRALVAAGTLTGSLLVGLAGAPGIAAPTDSADAAGSAAPAAAVTHEAENARASQGLTESNHAGFTGSGFVNYDNTTGSYVEWTVNAAQAGNAGLTLRYANGTTANRPMTITVNGTAVATGKAFNGTGAWTSWATTALTAALRAGTNTIRATATTAGGGPNVDHLLVDAGTTPPQPGTTPVGINGQLTVCGTKLCNQYGKPVQLRGMSTHGTQWYAQCLTSGSLDALAKDWNADVLRVSTYVQEDGWETDPQKFTDLAHSLIEQATARGMYVIVDWHMLDPGDPNANLANAKTFFKAIANRHKDKSNVFYEIANEPSGVSWAKVKSYAEQIIPVIRGIDSNAPVLVGTRAWSSLGVSDGADESETVNNQVNASNIMYTFHFYAASHGDEYLNALSRAADRIPMFVTEFGTQNYAGEGADDFTMSQKYLDLMAAKKISWTNWNFSDDFRSGAVFKDGTCNSNGPWTGTASLKPAGVWVRDRIRTADSFPTG